MHDFQAWAQHKTDIEQEKANKNQEKANENQEKANQRLNKIVSILTVVTIIFSAVQAVSVLVPTGGYTWLGFIIGIIGIFFGLVLLQKKFYDVIDISDSNFKADSIILLAYIIAVVTLVVSAILGRICY